MDLPEGAHCRVDIVGLADCRMVYLDRVLPTLNIHDLGTSRVQIQTTMRQDAGLGLTHQRIC